MRGKRKERGTERKRERERERDRERVDDSNDHERPAPRGTAVGRERSEIRDFLRANRRRLEDGKGLSAIVTAAENGLGLRESDTESRWASVVNLVGLAWNRENASELSIRLEFDR